MPQLYVNGEAFTNANPGSDDVFIQKRNKDGTILWTKAFGSSGQDTIDAAVWDEINGDILLYGSYQLSSLHSSDGAFDLPLIGGIDIYLVRIHQNGTFKAAQSFGGPSDDLSTQRLLVSNQKDGSIIIGGTALNYQIVSTLTGPNGLTLPLNGGKDFVFWARIDDSHATGRAYSMEDLTHDWKGLTVDPADVNQLIIAGNMNGVGSWESFSITDYSINAFLARVDMVSGSLTHYFEVSSRAPMVTMVASCNHIFMTGDYQGSDSGVKFLPDDQNIYRPYGGGDKYIAKLDTTTWYNSWFRIFSGAEYCSITSDSSGLQTVINCNIPDFHGQVTFDGISYDFPQPRGALFVEIQDEAPTTCPISCTCLDKLQTLVRKSESLIPPNLRKQ